MPTKFERTEEQAQWVAKMCCAGITHPAIARVLGITDDTLKKYFKDELDTSLDIRNTKASELLWEKVLSGDTVCLLFYLKTRAGFRESQRIELETTQPLSEKTTAALGKAYGVETDNADEDA